MVAIITGAVSLIGTIITVIAANRQTISTMQEQSRVADEKIQGEINVIRTEIKALSDRVERHNQMVERTYHLEERMSVSEEKIAVANHRIEDLEKGGRAS